jgi:RNA polymerase sigma factor (sigma-70 family)
MVVQPGALSTGTDLSPTALEPTRVLGLLMVVDPTSPMVEPGSAPGPDGGFEDFFRAEYDRAVRFAWLLTSSPSAAEDIAQEAFIGVQRQFAYLDRPARYLNAAIVNRAKTWQRDERRSRLKLARLGKEDQIRTAPADAELLDIVKKLPYRQRAVIVARYWCGWPETEIAQALGCRPGTVKSLASRALCRLQQEVKP